MPALPKCFWPLVLSEGVNDQIVTSAGSATLIADIPFTSAAEIAATLQSELGAGWAVTVSATGRFTFKKFGSPVTVDAGALATILGFVGGEVGTGSYQHQNGWYGCDPVVKDTRDRPIFCRAQSIAVATGRVVGLEYGERFVREIEIGYLPPHKYQVETEDDRRNEAIERFLRKGFQRFTWWADASNEEACADYAIALDSAKELPWNRLSPGVALYSLPLKFLRLPDDA